MDLSRAAALQGSVYSIAAWLAVAALLVAGRPAAGSELLACALLILLLGVPHGALDVRYARHHLGLSGLPAWTAFAIAYLLLAAVVVVAWQAFPLASLVLFLLVSVHHFAGDGLPGTDRPTRLLAGGAVIVLPALLHAPDVARYFAVLAGPSSAVDGLVALLHGLAAPWLAGCLAAVLLAARRGQRQVALELGSSTVLLALLPPLMAFCLYFCLMHGARHILRTLAAEERGDWPLLALLSALAMLGVLLLAAGGWWLLADALLEERVVRLVFIGLAALTLPHLLLVEPRLAARTGQVRPVPGLAGPPLAARP